MITIEFKYFICKTSYSFFYDRRSNIQVYNAVNLYKRQDEISKTENKNLARKLNELIVNSDSNIYYNPNSINYENNIMFDKVYSKLDISEIKAISIEIFRLIRILNYILKVNRQKLDFQNIKMLFINKFILDIERSFMVGKEKDDLSISENKTLKRLIDIICVPKEFDFERNKFNALCSQLRSLKLLKNNINIDRLYLLNIFKRYLYKYQLNLLNRKQDNLNIDKSKHIKSEINKIVWDNDKSLHKIIDEIYKAKLIVINNHKNKKIILALKSIILYNKINKLNSNNSIALSRKIDEMKNELSSFCAHPLNFKELEENDAILFAHLVDEIYKPNIYNVSLKTRYIQNDLINEVLAKKTYEINKYNSINLNKSLTDIYFNLGFNAISRKNDNEIYSHRNGRFVWKKQSKMNLSNTVLMYRNIFEIYSISPKLLDLQQNLIQMDKSKLFKLDTIGNISKSNLNFLDFKNTANIFKQYSNFLKSNNTNKFILDASKDIFFSINKLHMLKDIYSICFENDFLNNKELININSHILMNLKTTRNMYFQNNKLIIPKKQNLFICLLDCVYFFNTHKLSLDIYESKILFGIEHLKNIHFNDIINLELCSRKSITKDIAKLLDYKTVNYIMFDYFIHLNLASIPDLAINNFIRLSYSYLGQLYYVYARSILYNLPCWDLFNYDMNKPLFYNSIHTFMQKSETIRFYKMANALKIIKEIVKPYKQKLGMRLENILKLLELIHTGKIYLGLLKIILYSIEIKPYLSVSQIKYLKDITKYKLHKSYSSMIKNKSKIVFGIIAKYFYLRFSTILNSYIPKSNKGLEYKSNEKILYTDNSVKVKLISVNKLIIENLIQRLILQHYYDKLYKNNDIILNNTIIYQFLNIVIVKYLKYKKNIEIQKSKTAKAEKLPERIEVEQQAKLKKEKDKLEIMEEINIDKIAENIVINKTLKLEREKDKLYIEPIVKLIKEKPELYVEKDEQCLKMYKRGWFLRNVAPTDLLIVPKEDYPYNDYPAIVEAFYEDWDVYYWHHEKTKYLKKHPIPFGTELGIEHTKVSIEILVDMVNIVLMLAESSSIAFAMFSHKIKRFFK